MLVLLGVLLRLYRLGAGELWLDEGYTAALVQLPGGELLGELAVDMHPPLSFLLVQLATALTGSTAEWALRLPSALGGCLALLAGAWGLRRVAPGAGGLVALALLAFSPELLAASQEARMYALLLAAGVLHALAHAQWRESGDPGDLALEVAAAWVGVHLHYFFWLVLAGLSLEVLWSRPRGLRQHLLARLALVGLAAPWLVVAVHAKLTGARLGNEWRAAVSWGETLPRSLGAAATWLDGQMYRGEAHPRWWLPWVLLAAGAAGGAGREPGGAPRWWWRAGWCVLGVSFLAATLIQPLLGEMFWLPRYLAASMFWFLVLLAATLEALVPRLPGSARGALSGGLVLVLGAGAAGYASGERSDFRRQLAARLPLGRPGMALVLFTPAWDLFHYLKARPEAAGLPALWVDPPRTDERPGICDDLGFRDAMGAPRAVSVDELRTWLGSPGAPREVWTILLETQTRGAWFPRVMQALHAGRQATAVNLSGEPDQGFERVVVFADTP